MDTLASTRQSGQKTPQGDTREMNDFIHSFLFGDACITQEDQTIQSHLKMAPATEGWIGIPHGGIGMGLLMELALRMEDPALHPAGPYPFNVQYRLGGARLRVGDTVAATVVRGEDGLSGQILREGKDEPYLSAQFRYATEGAYEKGQLQTSLPANFKDIENRLVPMPYLHNCFVCGVERQEHGLRRRFYFIDSEAKEKIIVAFAGFRQADHQSFNRFQRNGVYHPLPILALLDETLGLSAFLVSASGGVTVRIDYTFYRDIRVGEKLLFWGRGGTMRGRAPSRCMCLASGGVAALRDDGTLEPVVSASGQWLGLPVLTQQMREALIPEELNRRAFEHAGA